MTRMSRDPISNSRSLGQLMPRPKSSRILGRGRPTNVELGTRMEYDGPHRRHAQ